MPKYYLLMIWRSEVLLCNITPGQIKCLIFTLYGLQMVELASRKIVRGTTLTNTAFSLLSQRLMVAISWFKRNKDLTI